MNRLDSVRLLDAQLRLIFGAHEEDAAAELSCSVGELARRLHELHAMLRHHCVMQLRCSPARAMYAERLYISGEMEAYLLRILRRGIRHWRPLLGGGDDLQCAAALLRLLRRAYGEAAVIGCPPFRGHFIPLARHLIGTPPGSLNTSARNYLRRYGEAPPAGEFTWEDSTLVFPSLPAGHRWLDTLRAERCFPI